MKMMVGIVLCACFLMASGSYSMDDNAPSSPALRSSSCSAQEVCDGLMGLALFIGCCIYDAPHYAEKIFQGSQEDMFVNANEMRSSWGPKSPSRPAIQTGPSYLAPISLEKKND